MSKELFENVNKITFINRPVAVPYNYRIIYKVSQVILILGTLCKRGGCSTLKLHIVSNALTSHDMMTELQKFLEDKIEVLPVVRFEPAITRAVNYGIAENLLEVQPSNSKIKLTQEGKKLYNEIIQDEEIMIMEKSEIENIKDKLTDEMIERITEKWGNTNATN